MSIYSNDNIRKIAKLTTRELPQKSKNAKITVRENNGLYSITISFLISDSITISGRCDVGMTCGGIVQCPISGRSAKTVCIIKSFFHEFKYKRFKTLLCLHVYRPCSSITLQPFRTCWSVCLLPHSLHLADTFLPHRCRFLNVGRQSMDALTAKLRTLYGRSYMTLLHVRSSCSIDINSRNFPWRSSVSIFFVHVVWNSSPTIPFIFFWSVFHFPSGVFSEAACTISAALTFP